MFDVQTQSRKLAMDTVVCVCGYLTELSGLWHSHQYQRYFEPAVFTLDLGRAHTLRHKDTHTYTTQTPTHVQSQMQECMCALPRSSRAAWQTLRGVCYVGRVECLFPSTRGWTALSIHAYTHMIKVKGGTHWVKGCNTGGAFMTLKSICSDSKSCEGKRSFTATILCLIFCYFFSPRWDRVISLRPCHDTHMHTHSSQRYFCVICKPSVGVCVYSTVYKALSLIGRRLNSTSNQREISAEIIQLSISKRHTTPAGDPRPSKPSLLVPLSRVALQQGRHV